MSDDKPKWPKLVDVTKGKYDRAQGRTGLYQVSGYIQEDIDRQLWGERGAKMYREMWDNSAVVGSMILILTNLLRQAPCHIEPYMEESDEDGKKGQSKPEDKERAQFVADCFEDMETSEDSVLSEAFSMIPFGYAPIEVTYKLRRGFKNDAYESSRFNDGQVGWASMRLIGQEYVRRWMFDDPADPNKLFGVEQWAPPDFQIRNIPREKFLLFRTTTHKGNPEGRSMLRSAVFEWKMVKRFLEFLGIGVEKDLVGVLRLRVPAEVMAQGNADTTASYNAAVKILENAKQNDQAGIMLPSTRDEKGQLIWDVDLIASPGTRQFDIKALIEFRELRILQCIAMDFIQLGHERSGSWALSDSKTDVLALICDALLDSVDDVFNREAIPRLAQLNGWPMDRLPKRKHGEIEKRDLEKVATFLTAMTNAGAPVFPNKELEDALMEEMNLPTRIEDETDTGVAAPRVDPRTGEPVSRQPAIPGEVDGKPIDPNAAAAQVQLNGSQVTAATAIGRYTDRKDAEEH